MSKNKEIQLEKEEVKLSKIETIETLEKEIVRLINERKSNHKKSNELIRQSKEKLALLIANKSK
jgi:hypothetical protein